MRNKIWGIIKDKIHVDGTFNPLGLTYFKTSNAGQVDELTDAILQAIRDEVERLRKDDKVYMCRLKMSRIIFNQALDQIKEALSK
jgi:hypothetical protein